MKPYICSKCLRAFSRGEHLERHYALHTGERPHRCSCGRSFGRSDALSRHLKGCRPNESRIFEQQRCASNPARRACDRCARLKIKCDYTQPCRRCVSEASTCSHDRAGATAVATTTTSSSAARPPPAPSSASDATQIENATTCTVGVSSTTSDGARDAAGGALIADLHASWGSPTHCGPVYNLGLATEVQELQMDMDIGMAMDVWASDAAGLPLLPPWLHGSAATETLNKETDQSSSPQLLQNSTSTSTSTAISTAISTSGPDPTTLCLEQLDPLMAKCVAIRALFPGPGPAVPNNVLESSVNRSNLLLAMQLCGKNFQRHIPFLHVSTFSITTALPALVFAMFVVGASYSNIVRPAGYIYAMAMRVLSTVQEQQHEIYMSAPPLSSIQAAITASAVLGSSQNEIGHEAVRLQYARNISMARRAGLLTTSPITNYTTLNAETFDWHAWVERESRIRTANTVFCQDMAACIFTGKPPSLATLELDIDLPSYEMCWNARSSAECLRHLQSTPAPTTFASAFTYLKSSSDLFETLAPREISAFGMFTLLKAIHGLIWQAIHHDLDSDWVEKRREPFAFPELANLYEQISSDFSGGNIVQLAAHVVRVRESSAFTCINRILDHWLLVWQQRTCCDTESENLTFSLDPMPFWLLAKLFLLLHLGQSLLPSGSDLAIVSAGGHSLRDCRASQARVMSWFERLRQPWPSSQPERVDSLAGLMAPISKGVDAA